MKYTAVYGDYPQTRNYFWCFKIHKTGCANIAHEIRRYNGMAFEYESVREIAIDYWAAHIAEAWGYEGALYDSEEAAIQSYIQETKLVMCPCAKKVME